MHCKIVAAEQRANEAQKKYDECKRNYFKLREERERLKSSIQAKEGTGGGSDETNAGLQGKYESLRNKFRVIEL